MLVFLVFLCFLAWVITLIVLKKQMVVTHNQIQKLPELPKIKPAYSNGRRPSVGQNLNGILPHGLFDQDNSHKVVVISLPTCSYCKGAIEELIVKNEKYGLQLINLMITNEIKEVEKYEELFGSQLKSFPISTEVISRLLINSYPTFLLVDHTNTIIFEEGRSRKLFGIYQSILKGGEH